MTLEILVKHTLKNVNVSSLLEFENSRAKGVTYTPESLLTHYLQEQLDKGVPRGQVFKEASKELEDLGMWLGTNGTLNEIELQVEAENDAVALAESWSRR